MVQKAPIYSEKDRISVADLQLITQLNDAVVVLEKKMRATLPIKRNGCGVGYGVDKAQRRIAADAVISIAKAIKAAKGW